MKSDSSIEHLQNFRWHQETVSAEWNWNVSRESRPEGKYVDSYYGRAWSFLPKRGDALYGLTEHIPDIAIPPGKHIGYLRTPYKRIPRTEIDSQDAMRAIAKSFPSEMNDVVTLWRGQRSEYYLDRSEEMTEMLFGEQKVLEPSLFPSSSRTSIQFETYMEGWFALVETYLNERMRKECEIRRPEDALRVKYQYGLMMTSYGRKRYSYAMAQHYGMPSVGLDLTPDIDVAIFFALHRFRATSGGGLVAVERIPADETPVIYGIGGPKAQIVMDELEHPPWARALRPKRQSAHFWSTGWGSSPNRAAEYLNFAYYLKNHGEWKLKYRVEDLFPRTNEDMFLGHLLSMWHLNPWLSDYVPLDRLYYC